MYDNPKRTGLLAIERKAMILFHQLDYEYHIPHITVLPHTALWKHLWKQISEWPLASGVSSSPGLGTRLPDPTLVSETMQPPSPAPLKKDLATLATFTILCRVSSPWLVKFVHPIITLQHMEGWNNEDDLGLLTLHRVLNATSRGGQTQLNLKWLREGGRTHISSGSLERKGGRWNNGDNCLQKLATFVCIVKFLEFLDGCVVIPRISATVWILYSNSIDASLLGFGLVDK